MVAIAHTFTFDQNTYRDSDSRDMFGRRVIADYIVEWSPTADELDAMDADDLRPPSWAYMGDLVREKVDPKHNKKRYDFFLEQHYADQGLDDPLYAVTLAVIDRMAS